MCDAVASLTAGVRLRRRANEGHLTSVLRKLQLDLRAALTCGIPVRA
jgi:hypothetical protein